MKISTTNVVPGSKAPNDPINHEAQEVSIKRRKTKPIDTSTLMGRLGRNIQEARVEAGITQEEAERRTGDSVSWASMERGKHTPGLCNLLAVCSAIRKPLSEIIPKELLPMLEGNEIAPEEIRRLLGE